MCVGVKGIHLGQAVDMFDASQGHCAPSVRSQAVGMFDASEGHRAFVVMRGGSPGAKSGSQFSSSCGCFMHVMHLGNGCNAGLAVYMCHHMLCHVTAFLLAYTASHYQLRMAGCKSNTVLFILLRGVEELRSIAPLARLSISLLVNSGCLEWRETGMIATLLMLQEILYAMTVPTFLCDPSGLLTSRQVS